MSKSKIAVTVSQQSSADTRARETEQQMTDDERFAMIVSVMGANFAYPRDKRIPDGVPMSAGYTPGVPRLGIPALQSSDASMGVTNPGYRPDDKGATRSPRRSSSARASTRSWRARGARQSF